MTRSSGSRYSDPALEHWIGLLLRVGIVASAALLGVGMVLLVATGVDSLGVRSPSTFRGLGPGGAAGAYLVFAGVFLLVLTPVVRVALSAVLFYLNGERRFVLVTLFVFLILASTVALGWL